MTTTINVKQVGSWSETFKLSLAPYGTGGLSTYYDFQGLTETVDIDEGDKGIESIPNGAGGDVVKIVPQEATTITLECYPTDIGIVNKTGFGQAYRDIQANWDTTEPLEQNNTRNRESWLVSILWTDDAANTGADEVTASSTNSLRYSVAHAWMTSYKPSFTDGILKTTISFMVPPFNKLGAAGQIHECSGDATALLAINSFGSTKFNPVATAQYTWHG